MLHHLHHPIHRRELAVPYEKRFIREQSYSFREIEFTIQKKLKTSSPINYHVLFLSVCIQPGSSLQIRSVPMARHMSKHLLIILTLLCSPASFHEEEPKRSKPPANEIHEPDLDPEVVVARA